MEIFECDQGSDEWFKLRMGIPTASEFGAILAKGRGGGESQSRKSYMKKLAAEIVTGERVDSYTNANMERGHIMEPEARNYYSFHYDVDLQLVGFIRNGQTGCSPDALVGQDGILQVKTMRADLLLGHWVDINDFSPEHKAQCMGELWITQRKWVDLLLYWPKVKPFIIRAYRDEDYIKTLAQAVNAFNVELEAFVQAYRTISGDLLKQLKASAA